MQEKKTVALLSNVTVDLVAGRLRKKYDFYIPEGFDTWVQEVMNPESGLYNASADAIVVLIDGTEARSWKSIDIGTDRISLWKQAVSLLCDKIDNVPIFVTTIDIRENRVKSFSERRYRYELENDWYQFVQGLIEERQNVYLLDMADAIADIGRNAFYSNKMWYMSSMPYSRDGLLVVGKQIDRALSSAFEARKKIIVLDLDNTLWGGVVGEDGVEGIELADHKEGQRFYDFQRQLLEMKKRGIVLAIISKNNAEDAEAAIQSHPAMLLHDEDFVSKKINWESKAINLKAMVEELNITHGGFVFVDDNPVEREIVGGECPEVTVPDFPADTTELLLFAENLWEDHFRPLRVLDEDLSKTNMYRAEVSRKHELGRSVNLDDYIEKLEMSVDIHRMRLDELNRVTQLCGKTNQFNLTTKRYTKAEIGEIAEQSDCAVYVAYSADKYGDSGLISVAILRCASDKTLIDTFLMSCRVMGRKLEDVIVNELASRVGNILVGEYIPTTKNAPVRNLYDKLGFTLVREREDGSKVYELNASNYEYVPISAYKIISFDGKVQNRCE